MSGRVSIKGKGASIFFGEEDPNEPAPPENQETIAESTDALTRANPDAATSRHQDVTTSALEAAHPNAREQGALDMSAFFADLNPPKALKRKLRAASREEHRFHTTIRFSTEDNDALRDVCYELAAKMGIEATRNDIGRLGLRLLLEDYALRKQQSLLVQILGEEEDEF